MPDIGLCKIYRLALPFRLLYAFTKQGVLGLRRVLGTLDKLVELLTRGNDGYDSVGGHRLPVRAAPLRRGELTYLVQRKWE